MYLTTNEIHESRYNTVRLFSDVSNVCLDGGNRLSWLFLKSTRQALAWSGEYATKIAAGYNQGDSVQQPSLPEIPAFANATCVQEEFCEVLIDIYKALLRAAEEQIRICDQLLLYAIKHGARTSPWEGEIALNTLRASVESAEVALHGITDMAIHNVEIVEEQGKQVTGKVAPSRPAKKPASRKRVVSQE